MAEKPAVFTSESAKRVARATLGWERQGPPPASDQRRGGGGNDVPIRCVVMEIFNDYLRCQTWDGTTEGGSDIYAAKVPELRHDVDYYPQLTAFTTVDTGEATVTYDGTDYTWKVTPDYVVGGEVWLGRRGYTGVTVNSEDLSLMDENYAGRAWGIEE